MAKNKAKKALIITAGVIVVLFAVLLIAPFAFKGKIMQVVKNQANEMLDAQLEFDDVNLSFIRNFPNASVSIENLCIVGKDSFATDTLIYGKNINAVVNLKSLFSDSGYEIKRLILNGINVNAHVLPSGKANWDIMKSDSTEVEEAPDTTALKFNLKLQDLQLKNTNIVYNDEQGAMKAVLKGLNFSTSGDFTADSSLLKTRLTIDKLTYVMDKVPYLSDAEIDVKADINADLNKMIFKLSDNTTKINAIELALNGWVQLLEPEGIAMDLSINSEKVDFKSILSMIPAIYSNQFKDLKADGKVELQAAAKGTMLGETYPTFKVKLLVENGWFQYPELPKQLKNININLAIDNAGDKLETMKIDLSQFSFDMGGNGFQAKAHIEDPLNDPNITATAAGKLDLGQVKDFYPLEEGINLNGVFALDVSLAGRMSYYEKNQYDKFQFAGNMSVTNLLLKTADLKDDVSVAAAQLNFNNRYVDLAKFQAKIGKNDIAASGKLENFVAYVLSDQTLNGQLSVSSNYLNLNDFMSADEAATATDTSSLSVIVIPKNLNFSAQANLKEVIYDKMKFANAHGNLNVNNGVVTFQNLGLQGFGGSVNLNGKYDSSNPDKPFVNMNMDLTNVAFKQIFEQVETFAKFAPILENLEGNFSAKLALNSALQNDMMPNLKTLLANGSLSTQSVGVKDVPALTSLLQNLQKVPLAKNLNVPDAASATFKNLLLNFTVEDGNVNAKPFDIALGDLKLNIGGASGLDKTLAWKGTATLPNSLNLGKFQNIGFTIGGTFSKPTVKLDLTNTLNAAVDELKNQATEKVTEKVDELKQKAAAELAARKAQAVEEAQKQADNLRAEAKKAGDKLIGEAQVQAKKLVDAAKNPLAKAAAEVAGKKLTDEAQKKATQLYNEADKQGTALVEKVKNTNE